MMGLEPTTFAMARRRSSQLSYIRVAVSIEQAFRRGRDHQSSRTRSPAETDVINFALGSDPKAKLIGLYPAVSTRLLVKPVMISCPDAVTTTWSSIRIPHLPGR